MPKLTHYCGTCWCYNSGTCEKHPQAEQVPLLFPHACYYACRDKVELVNPRPDYWIARCPHMKATSNTRDGARGNFWIEAARRVEDQERRAKKSRFVSEEGEFTVEKPNGR